MIDDEVDARIARTSAAFGRLTARLWKVHDVRLQTKLSVYNAAVLPSLLYGSETWTTYRRHVKISSAFTSVPSDRSAVLAGTRGYQTLTFFKSAVRPA